MSPFIIDGLGGSLVHTTINTLVREHVYRDSGDRLDPEIITYALGCSGMPHYIIERRLYQAMLLALLGAWKEAHKLKLFGWYFFPPKAVLWRNGPQLVPDPEVIGGWMITCRVGFK